MFALFRSIFFLCPPPLNFIPTETKTVSPDSDDRDFYLQPNLLLPNHPFLSPPKHHSVFPDGMFIKRLKLTKLNQLNSIDKRVVELELEFLQIMAKRSQLLFLLARWYR